ncbi:MAG: hypothetical protein ACTSRC_01640 [Candidatus Helarchaeota archaeon]
MNETQSKMVVLFILLLGFVFIGIGLTIGIYRFPEEMYYWPALAGLPIEPPSEIFLLFGL